MMAGFASAASASRAETTGNNSIVSNIESLISILAASHIREVIVITYCGNTAQMTFDYFSHADYNLWQGIYSIMFASFATKLLF
jgi:hypothetical protein